MTKRRWLACWMALALLLAAMPLVAAGASVDPVLWTSNQDPVIEGCTQYKIGNPASGTYYLTPTLWVTLNVYHTPRGQEFDWTSNGSFGVVYVKGGPNGYIYNYSPPVSGDTGLHAPRNPSGKWAGLSHISFYYCFVPDPRLEIVKTGDTLSKTGDTVNYSFTISNPGNVALTRISVIDDVIGDLTASFPMTLTPTASVTVTATHVVTPAQGALDTLTNTVTATYSSAVVPFANVVATDSHTVTLVHPDYTLTKAADPTVASPGAPITYTMVITNTGDVRLNRISVSDTMFGDIASDFPAFLDPLQSATITKTRPVAATDPNPLVNTVTTVYQVEGLPNQLTRTASAEVTIEQPECFGETAWAADGAPGVTRFTDRNWATYVWYTKGDGSACEPKSYPLYAAQTYLAGYIEIWDADNVLWVRYVVEGGAYKSGWGGSWQSMTSAHLHIAADPGGVPVNRGGPIPGQFADKWSGGPVDGHTFGPIGIGSMPPTFVIAAHAVTWWCGIPAE